MYFLGKLATNKSLIVMVVHSAKILTFFVLLHALIAKFENADSCLQSSKNYMF